MLYKFDDTRFTVIFDYLSLLCTVLFSSKDILDIATSFQYIPYIYIFLSSRSKWEKLIFVQINFCLCYLIILRLFPVYFFGIIDGHAYEVT